MSRVSSRVWQVTALLLLAACGDDGAASGAEGTSSSGAAESDATGVGTTSSSGGDVSTSEGGEAETGSSSSTTGPDAPLESIPGQARYALVGETVTLDGSASTGAVLYQWNFDDGSEPAPPSEDPVAVITYDTPGRYRPVLTVFDGSGNQLAEDVTITVTFEPTHTPRQSSTIAIDADDRAVVVSPDSDELTTVERRGEAFALGVRVPTCGRPRTVAWWGAQPVVACQDDAVAIHDLDAGTFTPVPLPYGARPFGVVVVEDDAFVTLQGTGAVARIALDGTPTVLETLPAITDARGIAAMPDGRLGITRWRSPDAEGQLVLLDPQTGAVEPVALQFDPQAASDTEAGGVPSYLTQLLISPIGDFAAVPSLQANIDHGTFINGDAFTFETTLRGVVSYLDVGEGMVENFSLRRHFDNRGFL
ncbi:MAG: PKD domain-containing protein, partial [Myxococcota bacterium]